MILSTHAAYLAGWATLKWDIVESQVTWIFCQKPEKLVLQAKLVHNLKSTPMSPVVLSLTVSPACVFSSFTTEWPSFKHPKNTPAWRAAVLGDVLAKLAEFNSHSVKWVCGVLPPSWGWLCRKACIASYNGGSNMYHPSWLRHPSVCFTRVDARMPPNCPRG